MRTLLLASVALAASATAAHAQSNSITFYELPGYLGRSVTVTEETPNLAASSIARKARSARVTGDWTVCTGADYGGTCRQLTANQVTLLTNGLDRKVVSLRPTESEDAVAASGSTSGSGSTANSGRLADLDVASGTEGQDVEFYARPTLGTQQVAVGTSDRTAADAYCRLAGYTSSAYSGRARVQASNLIDAGTGASVRSFALRDVLCRK